MNTYKNFEEAGESNWELLEQLYLNKYKLLKPEDQFSIWDGMIKKENRLYVMCEVKRRQFTTYRLINSYNSQFFLEKEKYDNLHKERKEYINKYPWFEFKIYYISETCDGITYIFDITNKDFEWTTRKMKIATYKSDEQKEKEITYLHIDEAIEIIKYKMIYRELLKLLSKYVYEKSNDNKNKILIYILDNFEADVNVMKLFNYMIEDNRIDEIIEWCQNYIEKRDFDNYLKNKEDEDYEDD